MRISNLINEDDISQVISKDTIEAMDTFVQASDMGVLNSAAVVVAKEFGDSGLFQELIQKDSSAKDEKETKFLSSFHKNLNLLVQKTWIEKADETLKEQAVVRIDNFCDVFAQKKYNNCYSDFLSLLYDVVYLMFGIQTKKDGFLEYAMRIDPEFGIFWWYICSLPADAPDNEEKTRLFLILGMTFLTNY